MVGLINYRSAHFLMNLLLFNPKSNYLLDAFPMMHDLDNINHLLYIYVVFNMYLSIIWDFNARIEFEYVRLSHLSGYQSLVGESYTVVD